MYRIRMPDGTEASYATVEEFSTAVVEGRVPDTAAIYHQRAEKWLAIAAHPHFKAALEKGPTRPAAAAPRGQIMASGQRPALRIPTMPTQASPSVNGSTGPRIAAVAPKPVAPLHTETSQTSHRTVAPSAMVTRLQALTAEATARTNGAAVAPTAPTPVPPAAPTIQAAATAPSDPTEALELLPENELPPVAPPAAVKLPTVHSKPKLPAIRPAEPVAETSPLGGLNPLEPEAPRSELASPEIESLVPASAPENPLLTSRSTHLEGLPLVEIPDTAGPLPYVTDHAPAARHSAPHPVVVAPPMPVAAPIPAAAPAAEIEAPVFEHSHYTAPKSRRGLLVAAGVAAVLVIAVSAFLLRPSASEAANAESVQVSTSAAQQAAPPAQQPVTSAPLPQPNTPASTEPTIEKSARVEPALRQERASRNRVDPTPAEAANAGEDGVVPAARLPVPTSIDASIKVGAEQSGQPALFDRDKALEATRKAIVDRDR